MMLPAAPLPAFWRGSRPRGLVRFSLHLAFAGMLVVISLPSLALAQAFESRALRAMLYDVNSRTVLYARGENDPFEPASMAKVLTAAIIFERLADGSLRADQTFAISEDAWRRGGGPSGRAAMFAELGSNVPVIDLLRGLIVIAGNDAAIALAEGVAGSEAGFAQLMTEHAGTLGARNSFFANATGEPEGVGMRTTVRDMVDITTALIETHPGLYALFAQEEFTWNGITQRNRNPIYTAIEGADGLVAGYSDDAGYGLVGSVIRDGRRVIFALSGVDTAEGRVDEARRLVRYAYEDFRTVRVAEPGEPIAFARTHGGEQSQVGLVAQSGAVELLLPREGADRVRARVVYESPVPAPIQQGAPIARLLVERDGTIIQETALVAASDVAEGSLAKRARDGFLELILGWLPPISFAGSL